MSTTTTTISDNQYIQLGKTYMQHQNLLSDLRWLQDSVFHASLGYGIELVVKEYKAIHEDTIKIRDAVARSMKPVIVSGAVNGKDVDDHTPPAKPKYYNLVDTVDLSKYIASEEEIKDLKEGDFAVPTIKEITTLIKSTSKDENGTEEAYRQYLLYMLSSLQKNGWLSSEPELYKKILNIVNKYPVLIFTYIGLLSLDDDEKTFVGLSYKTALLLSERMKTKLRQRIAFEFDPFDVKVLLKDRFIQCFTRAMKDDKYEIACDYDLDRPTMSMRRFCSIMGHSIRETTKRVTLRTSSLYWDNTIDKTLDFIFGEQDDGRERTVIRYTPETGENDA